MKLEVMNNKERPIKLGQNGHVHREAPIPSTNILSRTKLLINRSPAVLNCPCYASKELEVPSGLQNILRRNFIIQGLEGPILIHTHTDFLFISFLHCTLESREVVS